MRKLKKLNDFSKQSAKIKKAYIVCAAITLIICSATAFAAGDPLAVVNNLSTFKLYMYTAIAPIPLSGFAGEPTSGFGRSFLKSYAAVCLEGAVIVLGCIIFSVFAASPPVMSAGDSPTTMVWKYMGELIFNLLVLTGAIKMADRVVKEMLFGG